MNAADVALAANHPELPVGGQVVLALVFVVAALSVAARRGPTTPPEKD
ncbi:hypothetical protein [Streptomyces sp. NPDC051561]